MSHQRYASHDPVKEPHSISLKVLRLSRPSLVAQHAIPTIESPSTTTPHPPPVPASLAYTTTHDTNPSRFLLSPILNLPPSFGSAYVGETFSCTLCANHEIPHAPEPPTTQLPGGVDGGLPPPPSQPQPQPRAPRKHIRDVRIEAEMKTPASQTVTKLTLWPSPSPSPTPTAATPGPEGGGGGSSSNSSSNDNAVDLDPGRTLQRIVNFDLKEEGNHVLGVTVSYYEATETSGRTRTFRKLYQFVCKPSLIVRTKVSPLPSSSQKQPSHEGAAVVDEEKEALASADADAIADADADADEKGLQVRGSRGKRRRWVLEAQLENCSEDTTELERVVLDLEAGLSSRDCNWGASGSPKPVLHPGEVEQVCFVIEESEVGSVEEQDGKIIFGILSIAWRSEMGQKGFLATNKLGTRHVK